MPDPRHHERTYYLNLFDRTLDETGWVGSLKALGDGRGYELLQARAAVGARMSLAVARLGRGAYITTSEGGAHATGSVSLTRLASGGLAAVVVKAGSRFTTPDGGVLYEALADTTFAAADAGPHTVAVRCITPGWEGNQPAPFTAASGEAIPGPVSVCDRLLLDPPYGDTTIACAQVGEITGGRAPMLDGLGADRGMPRETGEPDNRYRLRLRGLPDTVSPGAVLRAAHSALDPAEETFEFIETFESDYQTCWDAPTGDGPLTPPYSGDLFTYDDPDDLLAVPFRNRWLDSREDKAAFIVVVDQVESGEDFSCAYDDDAVTFGDHLSPHGGLRAISAFDVPPGFVSAPEGLECAFDGEDPVADAVYGGLWSTLQRVKAGGVAAILELHGQ